MQIKSEDIFVIPHSAVTSTSWGGEAIGRRAEFMNLPYTHIIVPDGVEFIDCYTFKGCRNLINITLLQSLTTISYEAFRGCSSLTNITLPISFNHYGGNLFSECPNFTRITIDSDDGREIQRIRALFPENLKRIIISRSQSQAIEALYKPLVTRFHHLCPLPSLESIPKIEGGEQELIVSAFDNQYTNSLLQEFRTIPFPNDQQGFADYSAKLNDILQKRMHAHQESSLIYELEKYLKILDKQHPGAVNFFSTGQRPTHPENVGILKTIGVVKKLITSVQSRSPIEFSAEEKSLIKKRPLLLKSLPQQLQQEIKSNEPRNLAGAMEP